ncbi:MAG: leucyl aminopeptidase [Chloroflexi bacterium]|nr:leucyl aminopeptidase [Chloroflexota bacterium]
MELRVVAGDILGSDWDCIVVNLFEGVKEPAAETGAVDAALGGYIKQLIAEGEIKGTRNERTLVHSQGRITPKRVLVVGMGKRDAFSLDSIRDLGGDLGRYLRGKRFTRVASVVHGAGEEGIDGSSAAQALVEGLSLGLYRFRKHFSKNGDGDDGGEIAEFALVERDAAQVGTLANAVDRGRILAEATALARDLANEPANYMTPTILAARAQAVAETYGLTYTCFEKEEIAAKGMGAFLGVARGSHEPPKFIVLEYRGDPNNRQATLGLLGKGITFDSGGISIKPAANMGEMKGDMAGGASVIAAMQAIAQLKPIINVTGIVPATENLPGGGATKPGDVLVAMNKKTIEVENTDAEGRLILADALCYANEVGLRPLVDVATLTGAIRVALGTVTIGLFANDDEVADRIVRASSRSGEKVWRMPLWDEYKEQNKSRVADIKNTGGQPAGSITAAQFLHEFAGDTPWAHLDIAGVMTSDKDKGWQVRGASGQPVRTLVNFVLDLAERHD